MGNPDFHPLAQLGAMPDSFAQAVLPHAKLCQLVILFRLALREFAIRTFLHTYGRICYQDKVKATLRKHPEEDIVRGVDSVPTFPLEVKLFWSFDGTETLLDVLTSPVGG